MKVIVTDLLGIEALMNKYESAPLISIGSPLTVLQIPVADTRPYIRKTFDDLDILSVNTELSALAELLNKMPTPEIVTSVMCFAEEQIEAKADIILIHCEAGISRSQAFGYLIRCMVMPPIDAAVITLSNKRAHPNVDILRLGAAWLEHDGYVSDHKHVMKLPLITRRLYALSEYPEWR
jgi:predicted protein tyrosine phosphatase